MDVEKKINTKNELLNWRASQNQVFRTWGKSIQRDEEPYEVQEQTRTN